MPKIAGGIGRKLEVGIGALLLGMAAVVVVLAIVAGVAAGAGLLIHHLDHRVPIAAPVVIVLVAAAFAARAFSGRNLPSRNWALFASLREAPASAAAPQRGLDDDDDDMAPPGRADLQVDDPPAPLA